MNYDIVYTCNSTNNKNVRANELNILRKFEDKLYFEFGDSENNIKKRFYKDVETLNKDFEAIQAIKEHLEDEDMKINKENEIKSEEKYDLMVEAVQPEAIPVANATEPEGTKTEMFKKVKNKGGKRKIF